MSFQPTPRWDRETALLAWLTACVSIFSFLFYFRRGDILLYGDAVAHINIARRVFDSRTPGLLQLGTVWLPLPHLLMIPFLFSNWMWNSGAGGSIPSMAAYVFGTLGIFRLVRSALTGAGESDGLTRATAWASAAVYAANPNLIFLQATAMTEPLYLALSIWAVVYFNEFLQEAGSSADGDQCGIVSSLLVKCGICLAAACLTRYDAWFLTGAICTAAVLVLALNARCWNQLRTGLRTFILLATAAPLFWLAYNAAVYRNPLEFANGPYSAKAIEQKTPGASHPGSHNLQVAVSYFLKSAELNVAAGNWQRPWILLALAGALTSLIAGFARNSRSLLNQNPAGRQLWPLLLLWIPLPFYALSVAHGGVPIFIPVWWPFSYYNVRYGLQLLPAFAVFASLAFYFMTRLAQSRAVTAALAGMALILVGASYISIWRDPVCFREAWINSRTRIALEQEVADFVKALPPDSTLLMYLGDHVGALQEAGIPLRRVIYEGNHRVWRQPIDAEGLWERALVNPSQYADFVIAFEGDPVSVGVRKIDLVPLAVLNVSGQSKAVIYRTRAQAR